jgi:hypothetical protein
MTMHRSPARGSAMIWVVLLIVALGLAAFAVMFLGAEPQPLVPNSETRGPAKEAAAPAKEEAATRKATTKLEREPTRSEKGISFTVYCLGPGGGNELLADVEIEAFPAVPTGVDTEHRVTAKTDAKGIATFEKLPYTTYDVQASPAGYVPLRSRGVKEGSKIEFLFRKGIPLTGVVTSAEGGAPIAGAFVQVQSDFGGGAIKQRIQIALRQGVQPTDIQGHDKMDEPVSFFRADATTDASGRYSIAAVPNDVKLIANVDHESFDTLEDPFDVKDQKAVEHNFALFPRTEIYGKVVRDDTGDPIPGAKVLAGEDGIPIPAIRMFGTGSAAILDAVADANGAYRLKRIARGRQYLMVELTGYEVYTATFDVTGSEPYQHEIRLKAAAGLTGQVLDNANNPIEGVSIYWVQPDANILGREGLPKEPHTRTAADGTFQLRALPVGRPFNILARHPQFVNAEQDHFILQPGEEMSGVQILMNRGGQITGEVLDALRQPLAGASIVARPVKPQGTPLAPVVSTPDGSFVVSNTQPAMFELSCSLPGYVTALSSNVRDFATGVQFVLVKEAIYSGRFVDQGGQPLTKFRIRIRPSERFTDRDVRTENVREKEGKFEVKGLAPGLWDFEFSAEDVTPLVMSRVTVREGEKIENQELRAQPGASVGGIVKATSGKAIGQALVRMDFVDSFSHADKSYTDLQASSKPNGEFEIKNLLPGHYKIWVAHPQFAPSGERDVEIDPSGRTTVNFDLSKPGSLRLIVRDAEGNTVPSAKAFLFKGDSPFESTEKIVSNGMVGLKIPHDDPAKEGFGVGENSRLSKKGGLMTPVGETGELTFTRKEPGHWTLWVTGDSYYKYTAPIELEPGKETVHEATLRKLEPGVPAKDAYVKSKENARKKPPEPSKPKETMSRAEAVASLSAEQRAVMQKQRNGEELTAEEMKIFKEARSIISAASGGKTEGANTGMKRQGGKGKAGKGGNKEAPPTGEKQDGGGR